MNARKKLPYDPLLPSWSIMTKSRSGTVSVIRDLTLEEARRTYERLDPWYGHHERSFSVHKDFLPEGVWSSSSGVMRHGSDGDIEVREVFGPPGWSGFDLGAIDRWPKITRIWTDNKGNILPREYQSSPEAAAAAAAEREMQAARRSRQAQHATEPPTETKPQVKAQSRRGLFGWPWFS